MKLSDRMQKYVKYNVPSVNNFTLTGRKVPLEQEFLPIYNLITLVVIHSIFVSQYIQFYMKSNILSVIVYKC